MLMKDFAFKCELNREEYRSIKAMGRQEMEKYISGIYNEAYMLGFQEGQTECSGQQNDDEVARCDKEFRQLRSLHKEIKQIEERMAMICDQEESSVAAVVQASSKTWPYLTKNIAIRAVDPECIEERKKALIIQRDLMKERLKYCSELETRILMFISGIEESELRRIAEYRYLEGMKWEEIGKLMDTDRTTPQKQLKKELIKWLRREKMPGEGI